MNYSDKVDHVKKQLQARVKVSIVWDGYYDPNKLEDVLEADELTKSTFPFEATNSSLESKALSGVDKYDDIKNQVKQLNEKIIEESKAIVDHADSISQDVMKIHDGYFDYAAKKLEKKLGVERVLKAPSRWIPYIS